MQKRNPAGERLLAECLTAVHLRHSTALALLSSALTHSSLFFSLSHGGDASSALGEMSALKHPPVPAPAALQTEGIYQQSSLLSIFLLQMFWDNSLCKPSPWCRFARFAQRCLCPYSFPAGSSSPSPQGSRSRSSLHSPRGKCALRPRPGSSCCAINSHSRLPHVNFLM